MKIEIHNNYHTWLILRVNLKGSYLYVKFTFEQFKKLTDKQVVVVPKIIVDDDILLGSIKIGSNYHDRTQI